MRTITVACFSPTGGTRRAAQAVVEALKGEAKWLDLLSREQRRASLSGDELLVLALPVYAGQIPAVEGLLDGLRGEGTPCVLVAAYGNRHYDAALAQMKQRLEGQGFWCAGAAAVVTPHVFAPALGVGRPDGADRARLEELAARVEEKLACGSRESARVPGEPCPEPRRAVPVKKDRDWDICLGCAQCAKACPTGAMDVATLFWRDDVCISCMSCVAHCPVGALGFNSSALAEKLTANFSARREVELFL